VFGQSKDFAAEGAEAFGDGSADEKAEVARGDVEFGVGDPVAVEEDGEVSHGSSIRTGDSGVSGVGAGGAVELRRRRVYSVGRGAKRIKDTLTPALSLLGVPSREREL
jgi:hypothetical protein